MLPVPPQPIPKMLQTPPLLEGAPGEYMTAPRKRRDRSNPPLPQLTIIPDDLGVYISKDAQLVRDLGWEDFV